MIIMHHALYPAAASNTAHTRAASVWGWPLRACCSRDRNTAASEAALLHVAACLQGQEATAAVLTQSRQYFSLSVDFSEDVSGGAKVRATARGTATAAADEQ
jgi:hypothetical protein